MNNGTELFSYQWDMVDDVRFMLTWFMSEEAAAEYENYMVAFLAKPYWERAAIVLEEFLDDKGFYDDVSLICYTDKCVIKASVALADNAVLEQEFTFDGNLDQYQIFELLVDTYKVPYWEANAAFTEDFWEAAVNWLRIRDDKIARQEGWVVAYAEFVADVVTAPTGYPTVHGWITGEHWRTGTELEWREQALGVFDVIPAEALAKAGITAFVIKIGDKVFDFSKVTIATRNMLISALHHILRF
ncbi:MAG: hypothetical protein OEW75_00920 [Cyclobacteriaceae bacterium]|nr:hypothetical protein [Cyclobacteriaceae bacterium]